MKFSRWDLTEKKAMWGKTWGREKSWMRIFAEDYPKQKEQQIQRRTHVPDGVKAATSLLLWRRMSPRRKFCSNKASQHVHPALILWSVYSASPLLQFDGSLVQKWFEVFNAQVFISFVDFIPRYFILSDAIVSVILFLILFLYGKCVEIQLFCTYWSCSLHP